MNKKLFAIALVIAAALSIWAYHQTHNSDYHVGYVLGKASFDVEDMKDLDCLQQNIEALRNGSSQQCDRPTRDESDPKVIVTFSPRLGPT